MGSQRARLLLLLAFLLAGASLTAAAENSSLQLSSSTELSKEGFLSLSWSGVSGAEEPASLELALDDSFVKLVRTVPLNSQVLEKHQVHISGLQDGAYVARLVSPSYQPLSNTLHFEVRHRSLQTALAFFAVGALLFVALVAVVIRFSLQEQ